VYDEKNGTVYNGSMKMVKNMQDNEVWIKHGFGCQSWPDGAKYEGDWNDDKI